GRAGARPEHPAPPPPKTSPRAPPTFCPPQATRALGPQSDRQRPPVRAHGAFDSHRDAVCHHEVNEDRRRWGERREAAVTPHAAHCCPKPTRNTLTKIVPPSV